MNPSITQDGKVRFTIDFSDLRSRVLLQFRVALDTVGWSVQLATDEAKRPSHDPQVFRLDLRSACDKPLDGRLYARHATGNAAKFLLDITEIAVTQVWRSVFLVSKWASGEAAILERDCAMGIDLISHIFDERFGKESKQFDRLSIEEKLNHMKSKFSVTSDLSPVAAMLYRIRNCLVHREGVVLHRDSQAGTSIVLEVVRPELYFYGPDGNRVVLRTGTTVPAHTPILLSPRVPSTRTIKLGELIDLSEQDIHDIAFTLYLFMAELTESAQAVVASILASTKAGGPATSDRA